MCDEKKSKETKKVEPKRLNRRQLLAPAAGTSTGKRIPKKNRGALSENSREELQK